MKQLLLNSLLSLVTGFCFVAGALLAANLMEEDNREEHTYVDEPQSFKFLNHKRIDGEANFTVKGWVENSSNTEWDNIQLILKIYAGDAYMTYCRNSLDYVAPSSERPFTIVCSEVSGHNLPENVTYKLSVVRAAIKN